MILNNEQRTHGQLLGSCEPVVRVPGYSFLRFVLGHSVSNDMLAGSGEPEQSVPIGAPLTIIKGTNDITNIRISCAYPRILVTHRNLEVSIGIFLRHGFQCRTEVALRRQHYGNVR